LAEICRYCELAFVDNVEQQMALAKNVSKEDTAMQYALLIYGSQEVYDGMTQEEQAGVFQGHNAFFADVQQRGIFQEGKPLQPPSNATTVRVRDGKTLVTDGPFAETKEQLGGFYILDCKDLDEAIALATRIPEATFGSIEIRPVMVIEM
jgi:hypothetical protein